MMAAPQMVDGKSWEQRARRFLESRGLRTVHENFIARTGEIDLIMLDGQRLVFVEVRMRKASHFGNAAASVDGKKQARLKRTAMVFLQRFPNFASFTCRFDVIAWDINILGIHDDHQPQWLKGVF
jgi:putative endonuclease